MLYSFAVCSTFVGLGFATNQWPVPVGWPHQNDYVPVPVAVDDANVQPQLDASYNRAENGMHEWGIPENTGAHYWAGNSQIQQPPVGFNVHAPEYYPPVNAQWNPYPPAFDAPIHEIEQMGGEVLQNENTMHFASEYVAVEHPPVVGNDAGENHRLPQDGTPENAWNVAANEWYLPGNVLPMHQITEMQERERRIAAAIEELQDSGVQVLMQKGNGNTVTSVAALMWQIFGEQLEEETEEGNEGENEVETEKTESENEEETEEENEGEIDVELEERKRAAVTELRNSGVEVPILQIVGQRLVVVVMDDSKLPRLRQVFRKHANHNNVFGVRQFIGTQLEADNESENPRTDAANDGENDGENGNEEEEVGDDFPNALKCPICLQPFTDPFIAVPSARSYCFRCLDRIRQGVADEHLRDPFTRETIGYLVHNRAIADALAEYKEKAEEALK